MTIVTLQMGFLKHHAYTQVSLHLQLVWKERSVLVFNIDKFNTVESLSSNCNDGDAYRP